MRLEENRRQPIPFSAASVAEWLLGLYAALMTVAWAPIFLQWPRSGNHEHFASMALGWTRGLLPYRDLLTINFPGEIYLFSLLGAVCGWSAEWSIYAFDLGSLAVLACVLALWSRRLTGRYVAALGTITLYLSYYTTQWYFTAAERDSHVAILAVLCLVLPLGWQSAWSAALTGILFGVGFSIRPHIVVFAPAIATALLMACPRRLHVGRGGWVAGRWLAAAISALFVIGLSCIPLAASGLWHHFLEAMQLNLTGQFTPLGGFARPAPATLIREVFWTKPYLGVAILVACISIFLPWMRWRAVWLVLALAQFGSILYILIHPARHNYLEHPLMAVWALSLGLFLAELCAATIEQTWAATIAFVLAIALQFSHAKYMGSLGIAIRTALGKADRIDSWRRQAETCFSLSWEEYRNLRHWLNENTDHHTRIANFTPGITLGSNVGRLPGVPIEGTWLWYHHGTEPAVREALESDHDIVVLWNPKTFTSEIGHFPQLIEVIEKRYRPVAQFGPMEVRSNLKKE